MTSALPPDGFADEQSGPPDGFADEPSALQQAQPGLMGKVWNDLKIPEQMSRSGLNQLAGMVPQGNVTGNLPMDILRGTPKIAADTLAQVAPGFVSRGAIATAGAAKGVQAAGEIPGVSSGLGLAGRSLANIMEKIIGIPAKNTEALFQNPSAMITAPTEAKVSAAYNASEVPGNITPTLENIVQDGTATSRSIVKRAGTSLLSDKPFTEQDPEVFVKGRKALDKEIASIQSQITTAGSGKSTSALQDLIHQKLALREQFNNALDIIAPNYRAADALATKNYDVAPFRSLTLPGKMNLFSPAGIARGVPILPQVAAAGIGGLGLASQQAGNLIQNPLLGSGLAGTAIGLGKQLDQ
jgi:hypothetical protein